MMGSRSLPQERSKPLDKKKYPKAMFPNERYNFGDQIMKFL